MKHLQADPRRQAGQALLSVLVASMLLMAIVLGLMLQARGDMRRARNQSDWEAAFYLAWAGVEHALADLSALPPKDLVEAAAGVSLVHIPATELGRGTYSTSAAASGNYRFEVISEGLVGDQRRRIRAILGWRMAHPSYYDIWGAENYRIGGNSIISGDMYSQNDIILDGSTIVQGDVYASGIVDIRGSAVVEGTVNEGVDLVDMPVITTEPLGGLTTHELFPGADGKVHLDCRGSPLPEPCMGYNYIWSGTTAPLWVRGTFTGRVVISAAGDIEVTGDILKGSPASVIAVVTEGKILLNGGIQCDCLLFSGANEITLPGNTTVNGTIIARNVDNKGNLFFNVDPLLSDLMPGIPGVRLVVVEWSEI